VYSAITSDLRMTLDTYTGQAEESNL